MGLVSRAAIETLLSVEDGDGDRTASSAGITPHTKLLDAACAAAGIYHGFLESTRARRLISAGQRNEARRNLDAALQAAADNDEHFYDAELPRIRAHTHRSGHPDSRVRRGRVGPPPGRGTVRTKRHA